MEVKTPNFIQSFFRFRISKSLSILSSTLHQRAFKLWACVLCFVEYHWVLSNLNVRGITIHYRTLTKRSLFVSCWWKVYTIELHVFKFYFILFYFFCVYVFPTFSVKNSKSTWGFSITSNFHHPSKTSNSFFFKNDEQQWPNYKWQWV